MISRPESESRRQWLCDLAGTAACIGVAGLVASCSERGPSTRNAVAIPDSPLVAFALGLEAIGYAGPICAAQLYPGAGRRAARQALMAADIESRLAHFDPSVPLADRIAQAVQGDFRAERVIDLKGWQLSETECRLAALAASLQGIDEPVEPERAPPRTGHIVDVTDWGPQFTVKGEVFNPQPDGHSGLWFRAQGAPPSLVVRFQGRGQATQVYADLFTSGLRGEFMYEILDRPGEYPVELFDKASQVIQPLGTFRVLERSAMHTAAADFDLDTCAVYDWGPMRAVKESPFNVQPGGESAFWVKTNCALKDSRLQLNGQDLDTAVQEGLLTALVPDGHRLAAGNYPLVILLGDTGRSLKVGELQVE